MNIENMPKDFVNMVEEFIDFLEKFDANSDYAYEILKSRIDGLKFKIQKIEKAYPPNMLKEMQDFFRTKTDKFFCRSELMYRARKWPEGYQGDHITLEMIYKNQPTGEGLQRCLDKYYLSRTLGIAVRSRLRFMKNILKDRMVEDEMGNWLVLGSGSCRELLDIPTPQKEIKINCIDFSLDAINYSKNLVGSKEGISFNFINRNIIRYVHSKNSLKKLGNFSTIYSIGLFDYIDSVRLIKLIDILYSSLNINGILIFSLKDKDSYEAFDSHWVGKWEQFFLRDIVEYEKILSSTEVPRKNIEILRDDTGVMIFFIIQKKMRGLK